MNPIDSSIRVLYSFPHKIGAARICTTAWHQVDGASKAGAKILLYTGSISRPFSSGVEVKTTLSLGKMRIPYRVLGTRRACAFHDWIVARHLPRLKNRIDLIHVWPLGALRTLKVARQLGITAVLERPNAHTRFAYEVVREECRKLEISMPPGHEHGYNEAILKREEREYELANYLLCPSDFVAQTFLVRGFLPKKLVRHQYGYDDAIYSPLAAQKPRTDALTVLFAGGCAPRKGLHYALEAWLRSSAHQRGTFLIAGAFIAGYRERLAANLAHPSIKVLGHRSDLPDLMRQSDVLVLPSIEEGSALVTSEARGCGCVLLVSNAAGAICRHNENALVHQVGDVNALKEHLDLLDRDKNELERLRASSLQTVKELTWTEAGKILQQAYYKLSTNRR